MSEPEPATAVGAEPRDTGVGSNFVSNYPPYSFWSAKCVDEAHAALQRAPRPATPLGLYVHVPFCRRRCKFCYFKIYTDKNARDVERYLDAMAREVERQAAQPSLADRALRFAYVGGGTPSFISGKHLRRMFAALRDALTWDAVEEVTFECEPGTLTRPKLEAIRQVGVTRLSLGVESFNDEILHENGRAHLSEEIYRVAPWIKELDFEQLNIDLIAGMVGETWDTWREGVRRTLEMEPDSVTIYQMELPYNTVYSRKVLDGDAVPVADWNTKRAWHDYAFRELEAAGYEVSSAYTVIKRGRDARFVYRDSVWRGCDLLGVGLSSFSHVNGVHFQNVAGWEPYLQRIESGEPAIDRAFRPDDDERLTREAILQLKRGYLDAAYFRDKFAVDLAQRFGTALESLRQRGMLSFDDQRVELTREGLLRVDQLLPAFYAERYQNARYT